jgi:transcriptional regulator GlxA family with amidase domain
MSGARGIALRARVRTFLSDPWARRIRRALFLSGAIHLSREFRKHYQSTIGEFIRKRRIEHACKLLTTSSTALSEIALACGFSDQSHFCAMFKGHTGLTPAKFRDMTVRV